MRNFFENIIGQDNICKLLSAQIETDKVSHAYLFTGPAGAQKIECAKEFAAALVGNEQSENVFKGTCVDVSDLKPAGVHGYINQQIKDIVKDSKLAPIKCKYKVFIIRNAELLSTSAANTFLKTLEEPEKYCVFILICRNKDSVLNTIVSRCQCINFNSLPYEKALEFISKESGCAPDDAKYAWDLFGGDTGKAVEYCLDDNMQNFRKEVLSVASCLHKMTDWETLFKCEYLNKYLSNILDDYKKELDNKVKEMDDVLENSALKTLSDQNKRLIANKQKRLLKLFCECLKVRLRNNLVRFSDINSSKNMKFCAIYIKAINQISEYEAKLSYNIGSKNFMDVVLLRLKHTLCNN